MLPAIQQAQQLMRQFDKMRPLVEALQRNDELTRQAAQALDSTALEAMKENLSAANDAIRDALRIDTAMLEMGQALAAQIDTSATIRAALQIDTPVLDAFENVTRAGDAIQQALQVDTSAFTAATKALSMQAETAVAMKAALQIDTSALGWATTIAAQFDRVRPLTAALQRAIPEFPKFELSPGVQEAMKSLSAMNLAPQLAAALEPPVSLAALLRNVAAQGSFAVPGALREAQLAAARIGSSVRLADLTPERFGIVLTEGETDAAWLRLMMKARAIAEDDDATPEDVIELAEEADAMTAAASPQAKGRVAAFLQLLLIAVIVDVLKEGVIAGGKALLLPYLVALPLSFQPVPPPVLPPAPLPFSAPAPDGGELRGIRRNWEVEGLPQIIRRAGPEAERRTLEFFGTGLSNRNTRQAYAQAVMRFMSWAEDRNLELADITVFTVSAYITEMSREYSARSVRQHLGAIRGLFDHLVAGKAVAMNPASSVRGPQDDRGKAKTRATVMQPQEIRLLLDSIDAGDCSGLRDRALIATMAYGFARVSAVVAMDVKDSFARDTQGWLRLQGRRGAYEIPLHPKAKAYLDAYIGAAGIAEEPDAPLWRTMTKERTFSGERVSRVDIFRMVKRRLRDADLAAEANCDSIRAAGIASYLANGGTSARALVQFEPGDGITPADIERIGI